MEHIVKRLDAIENNMVSIQKIDETDVSIHHNVNKIDSSIKDVTKKIKYLEIKKEKIEQHP